MAVHYPDHDEVAEPGELYCMAPGHTMETEAGTVLIEFSHQEEFRRLTEPMEQIISPRER